MVVQSILNNFWLFAYDHLTELTQIYSIKTFSHRYTRKSNAPLSFLVSFARAYLETTNYHVRFMLCKLPTLDEVKAMKVASTTYS